MSATNSTPNYGLPQYVADDKPTYLGDFNKAMLDIDTNMKTIENKAVSAESSVATANSNASQALENANTANTKATTAQATAEQAQTTATTAKNTAETAQSTATQAQSTATQANEKANQLETELNKFNINNFQSIGKAAITGSGTGFSSIAGSTLQLATNSDNSIFKLYGRLVILANSTGGDCKVTFDTPLRPDEEYNINTAGLNTQGAFIREVNLKIATTGKVTISTELNKSENNTIFLFPCLYFNKSFNDVAADI